MANPRLQVDVTADVKKFEAGMKKLETRMKDVGQKLNSLGTKFAVGVTLPLAAAGGAAIKLASDLEESQNKVEVAFGESSAVVKDFAKTTMTQFGIAQGAALEMTSLFGDMATGMGISRDAAAGMSMQLTGLAGDLASFKNIDIAEAQTALAGVFTGETESLKRLGVIITEAALEQQALEMGITKSVKAMSQQEKIQLRLATVFTQTKNAQGDFARTSEGAANQMRIFSQGLQQIGEQIGAIILPVFTKFVKFLNGLIAMFSRTSEETKRLVIIFGTVAASIAPILLSAGTLMTLFGKMLPVFTNMKKILKGVRLAFMGTLAPILLKVAALAGLILLGKTLMDTFEPLGRFFTKLFNNIRDRLLDFVKKFAEGFTWLRNKLADIFPKMVSAVEGKMDDFNNAMDGKGGEFVDNLKNNFTGAVEGASEIFGGLVDNVKETMGAVAGAVGGTQTSAPTMSVKPEVEIDEFDNSLDFDVNINVLSEEEYLSQMSPVISAYELAAARIRDIGTGIKNVLEANFQNIIAGAAAGAESFNDFARSVGNSVRQMIKAEIALGVAAAVRAALAGIPFPFNLAAAGAAAGAATALFETAVPKFADGGIVPAGFPNDTYPALLTSGEMVIPQGKPLPDFGMGGGVEVFGEFRVAGSDLIAAISNANNRTLR